jgi:hypothetical protein
LRHKNEEIRKLSEANERFHQLILEQDLDTRHALATQLSQERENAIKMEKSNEVGL